MSSSSCRSGIETELPEFLGIKTTPMFILYSFYVSFERCNVETINSEESPILTGGPYLLHIHYGNH